jgi:hypothetical protein
VDMRQDHARISLHGTRTPVRRPCQRAHVLLNGVHALVRGSFLRRLWNRICSRCRTCVMGRDCRGRATID